MPPEAVWEMSMWVAGVEDEGEGVVYWVMVRVTVA